MLQMETMLNVNSFSLTAKIRCELHRQATLIMLTTGYKKLEIKAKKKKQKQNNILATILNRSDNATRSSLFPLQTAAYKSILPRKILFLWINFSTHFLLFYSGFSSVEC